MPGFGIGERVAMLHAKGRDLPVRVRLVEVTSTRDLRKTAEGVVLILEPSADIPLEGTFMLTYEDGTQANVRVTGHEWYQVEAPESACELVLHFIDERNWSRRNPRES